MSEQYFQPRWAIAIGVRRRRCLASTLTFANGHDNFHVSFPNLLCMLQMASSRTSSIMVKKNQNGRFFVILRE